MKHISAKNHLTNRAARQSRVVELREIIVDKEHKGEIPSIEYKQPEEELPFKFMLSQLIRGGCRCRGYKIPDETVAKLR